MDEIAVEISNVPDALSEDFLLLYLENKFDNGDVRIESIHNKTAKVLFQSASDAEKIIKCEKLSWENEVMYVKPFAPSSNKTGKSHIPLSSARTVELIGDFSTIDEETLRLYMESERYGGGPIEELNFKRENCRPLVTFEKQEVAKEIASRKHSFMGKDFQAVLLESWPLASSSCAVEVHQNDKDFDKQLLAMIFENKRNGGMHDSIEKIYIDKENPCRAVVTFQDNSVVQSIMRTTEGSIKIDSKVMTLKVLKPARPPPFVADPDETKLLFTELGPHCLDDIKPFKQFVKIAAKAAVDEFIFCPSRDKVLVQFVEIPDYQNVLMTLCRKPCMGCMISVQKVARTLEIQISNVSCDDNYLFLYFEHPNHGGGKVNNIRKIDDCVTIISFNDAQTVDKVMKMSHKIKGTEVFISPYIEALGPIPQGFDCRSPPPLIPDDIVLPIKREIYGFILANPSHKNQIELELGKLFCDITWPTVISKCEVVLGWKKDERAKSCLVNAWPKDVEKCFMDEIDNYDCCEILIAGDVFDVVVAKIKKISPGKDKMLKKVEHDDPKRVRATGRKDCIKNFTNQVKEIEAKAMKELEISKQISSNSVRINSAHFKFFNKYLLKKFKVNFKLEFTLNEKECSISMKGQNEILEKCKRSIIVKCNDILQKDFDSFTVCPNLFKFFETDRVHKSIEEKFDADKIVAVLSIETNVVNVHSIDDMEKAIQCLHSMIERTDFKLDENELKLVGSKEWSNFISQLQNEHKIPLSWYIDERDLSFLTFSNDVKSLKNEVVSHLGENTIISQKIVENVSILKVLKHSEEFDEFSKTAGKNAVDVKIILDSHKPHFHIWGKKKPMKDVEDTLKEFCKKVERKTFDLEKKIEQMFNKCYQNTLQGICTNRKVDVILKSSSNSTPDHQVREPKSRKGFTPISVIKGSIADQDTQVIFNCCNKDFDLNHTAISKVLLDKAGSELQNELKKKLQSVHLKAGEVTKTDGYRLDCDFVYHGFCLPWDKDSSSSEKSIRSLIRNSLELADKEKMISISFPAFGTGKFKVPANKAAEIMLEEASNIASNASDLKEIKFVIYENDHETFKAFESELNKNISGKSSGQDDPSPIESDSDEEDVGLKFKDVGLKFKDVGLKFKDVCLQIVKGDLLEEKCDAIVNNTNQNFNIKSGALSKAIINKAGAKVVDECVELGQLKNGLAVTSSGNLKNCSHIFHLTGKSKKDWENVISLMLKKANKKSLSSISMPVLGTGRGNASVEEMADVIISCAKRYSDSKPKNLQLIKVVIPSDGAFLKFQDVLQSHKGASGGNFQNKSSSKKDLNTNKVQVEIYGLNETSVNEAKIDMIQEIDKMRTEAEIDCGVSDLPEYFFSKIEKQYKVKVTKVGSRKLKLSGQTDISVAFEELTKLIMEHVQRQFKSNELKAFAKYVTWSYSEASEDKAYGLHSTGILERAFQKQEQFASWTDKKNVKHDVDIKKMVDNRDRGGNVQVKRSAKGAIELPKDWAVMSQNETVILIPLNPGSNEFTSVQNLLHVGALKPTIVKIERIQNPGLFKQYECKKLDMESRANRKPKQIELKLWHGTSPTNLIKINTNNFNRSFSGAHGTSCGKGVYFAVNPDYSIRGYCQPDPSSGSKYIYLAKVLVGNVGQGSGVLQEPPVMDQSTGELFDSVADNLISPSMYVTFYDFQVYPEYLITFK